jgi:hypothetical protein
MLRLSPGRLEKQEPLFDDVNAAVAAAGGVTALRE